MVVSPWLSRACRDPHTGTVAITQEEDSNFAISCILLLLCCPSPGGLGTGTREGKGSHAIVPSTHYFPKPLALRGTGEKSFEESLRSKFKMNRTES